MVQLPPPKPLSADHRRPVARLLISEKIVPAGWLESYTTDLLNLLHVLGRLVELQPAQTALLDRILAGELIHEAELRDAGALRPRPDDADALAKPAA